MQEKNFVVLARLMVQDYRCKDSETLVRYEIPGTPGRGFVKEGKPYEVCRVRHFGDPEESYILEDCDIQVFRVAEQPRMRPKAVYRKIIGYHEREHKKVLSGPKPSAKVPLKKVFG